MTKQDHFKVNGWELPGPLALRRVAVLGRLKCFSEPTSFYRHRHAPGSGAVGFSANLMVDGLTSARGSVGFFIGIARIVALGRHGRLGSRGAAPGVAQQPGPGYILRCPLRAATGDGDPRQS